MTIDAWRKVMYPLIGIMMLTVFGFSLYQTYVGLFWPSEPSTNMGVPAEAGTLPRDDNRGAFIQLKPGADPARPSNLVQLAETDTPGIIAPDQAYQIAAAGIDSVVINQASIDVNTSDYRVYAIGKDPQETVATRLAGGKLLRIQPKAGQWAPGAYLVDVPSGGMFDTARVYYAFTVK